MKTCRGCGADRGLSEFYKCSGMADGHLNYCKSCVKARVRSYYRGHREQYAEYERSRANLSHRVEARRKYQEEHKEQIDEYNKAWTKTNAVRTAAYKREHYERNREEIIARSEEWGKNNAKKVKQFKANNKRKRRAARHASRGNFTAKEFEKLCESYGNKCLRCGSMGVVLEADHVVPLTRGGSDDIDNIQPLCGTCNRSKFVKIIDYRRVDLSKPRYSSQVGVPVGQRPEDHSAK